MLKLQTALAGAVGHRFHAAVVLVSGAVEAHARDSRRFRLLGDRLADRRRSLGLLALAHRLAGHRDQRAVGRIVHELRIDVLERAEHHEPRPLGRARDRLADPKVPADALLGARLWNDCHYLPPALPAFRRTCSPAYLMP